MAAGFGVPGAMLATVLAQVTTLALGVGLLNLSRTAWRGARWTLAHLRGDFPRSGLFGLTSFWLLAEVDIALARHYLGADAAGSSASAGGLVARALLFLPAAVAVAAVARASPKRATEGPTRRRAGFDSASSLWESSCSAPCPSSSSCGSRSSPWRSASGSCPAPRTGPPPSRRHGSARSRERPRLLPRRDGVEDVSLCVRGGRSGGGADRLLPRDSRADRAIVVGVSGLVAVLQYHAATAVCRWRPEPRPDDHDAFALSAPSTLELSVVLPCHNAGAGLRDVLRRLGRELEEVGSYEVIVVSDGSTDATVSIAGEFEGNGVRTLQYPLRSGKGQALRIGLSEARGRYIAFLDADGDIDPEALRPFLTLMSLYEPDIVLGFEAAPPVGGALPAAQAPS